MRRWPAGQVLLGTGVWWVVENHQALIRYSEDGDLEIDNNGAGRSLRGIAVGRKNWLFFGSDNGRRTAVVLTSLIATCKRLEINPFAYLLDIFQRISAHPMNRLEELLPDNWKAAHNGARNLPVCPPISQGLCQPL
jgi:hypothetical protein